LQEYFVETTLAEKNARDYELPISDFDQAHPSILDPLIKYDSKIIIRSKPNTNLIA